MARCATAYWRGRLVCKHSIPKLNALAASTGANIYVKPIQGCYVSSNPLSAGTHDQGGVYDVEVDGYTRTEGNLIVNKARLVLLLGALRWWEGGHEDTNPSTDGDNHHAHFIDPECPDLSASAREQVEQFRRGENGLVGTGDKDIWDRSTMATMLARYDAIYFPKASTGKTLVVKSGQTLGGIAAALGITLAALLIVNPQIKDANVVQPGQTITVPAKGATVAPKPTATPTPAPTSTTAPKPAPAPAPKPTNPAPALSSLSAKSLKAGARNATVKAYERALAAYLGTAKARSVGLTGTVVTDGYYGTATSAATRLAYRKLGVTPNATEPGPTLLKALSGANAAPKAAPARVDASKLHKGVSSRHVTAYQKALRAYVGAATAKRVNPAGATGFYGSQTEALTKAAYRKLGATPWATEPGPGLLTVLGLR